MKVIEYDDAASLWREAEAFIARDPANNTHQLSALKRIMDLGARHGERFFAVHAGDMKRELLGSAVSVDTQTLFLTVMPLPVAKLLARHMRAHKVPLAGAIGHRDVLNAFTDVYARPFSVLVELMLYQLAGEPKFGRAGGEARAATTDDLDLLVEWHAAFETEVAMIAVPTPLPERVKRRIDSQQLLLWMDDGKPVAFAGVNPLPLATARVGPVYTPPELRGRGYAQAVVAAASAQVQREGPRMVFLFTDAAYPASNKAYQRIGYVHLADHAHLLFEQSRS